MTARSRTIMVGEINRSIEALWLDYQFLTREIAKFIDKQDYDIVSNLLAQQERLQAIICEQEDCEFRQSERGKALLQAIQCEHQKAMQKMQFMLNQSKRRRAISQAYEGNTSVFAIGDNMNRKT